MDSSLNLETMLSMVWLKQGSHDKGSHFPEQLEVRAGEYRRDTQAGAGLPGVTGLRG